MDHHLRDRPEEPQPRDEILLIGPDGEPNGKISYVRRILSEDRHEELWEVLDRFNQIRIVTRWEIGDADWIEVNIED